MTHLTPLNDEFALIRSGDTCFERTVTASWGNKSNRIFGGYSAALSLAAAAAAAPSPSLLCSAHVLFLEAVQPGLLRLDVQPERSGRSLTAMRVTAIQDGRRVLTAVAWLRRDTGTTPADPQPDIAAGDPDTATPLPWLRDDYAFHDWLDTRGVDYPADSQTFDTHGDARSIDVWSRPRDGLCAAGLTTQLFDVLVADAHVADPALRASRATAEQMISLDLHLQWSAGPQQPGWRRLRAASAPETDGVSPCIGTLHDRHGIARAHVAQQAMVLPQYLNT